LTRIIPGGHGELHAHFRIAQPAECADAPPADLLDHGGDGGVRRWLALEKARLAACRGAIQIDALQEDAMAIDLLYLFF
jgi:hypothetical protein